MTILAVIPARFQSSRFPGKPLALLGGKPMIQHVYEKASQVPSIDEVLIATDDERIATAVHGFGGRFVLTDPAHATGTDRIVEVVQQQECDWVLNIQGDEPLINPHDVEQLIQQTQAHPSISMSTLMHPITDIDVFNDPHVVKVTVDREQHALYFSRTPIPYASQPQTLPQKAWKHFGIYYYQRDFLLQFAQWPRSPLEEQEQLEQLRVLEQGHAILCVEAQHETIGVDCPEDLIKAEAQLGDS